MNPELFALLHQHQQVKEEPGIKKLPEEVKEELEDIIDLAVDYNEEDYGDSDLVSDEQREKQARIDIEQSLLELYKEVHHAEKLLEDEFKEEEKNNPEIDPEAKFSNWEVAINKMNEKVEAKQELTPIFEDEYGSLQSYLGLGWPFLNRSFQFAKRLLDEEKYQDAHGIYLFLKFINPMVFEYWFGEAFCLQQLGKVDDAIQTYATCLVLKPDSSLVLYQLATCYISLQETQSAIEACNFCLELATEEENEEMTEQVQTLLQTLDRT